MKTQVSNVDELRNALRTNSFIEIISPLYFRSVEDCIDVAAIRDPQMAGQHLTICGGGSGYRDSTFSRLFDGAAPLLKFSHTGNGRQWDWELRLRGIGFDAYNHSGVSLDIDYMQLSEWNDVDFRNHLSEPYIVHDGVSGNRFINIGHFYNKLDGQLLNITDVSIEGGNAHSDWKERMGGIHITGGPHNPPPKGNSISGPGHLRDFHNEGCRIRVEGLRRFRIEGGYHLGADVVINGAPGSSIDPYNASWCQSRAILNGVAIVVNNV